MASDYGRSIGFVSLQEGIHRNMLICAEIFVNAHRIIPSLSRTKMRYHQVLSYHRSQTISSYHKFPPEMGNFCESRIGQCRARKPSFFAKSILEF